jgi:hypothetical protein
MTVDRQIFWTRLAAEIVMAFGLIIALGAHPATAGVPAFFADLLFWPLDGLQTGLADETRLLSAIGGGIMLGWGAMIFLLAGAPMRADPDGTRRIILISVGLWFVLDSTGSVLAGAPLNVLGNLAFLALFALPLRQPAAAAA